MRHEKMPAVMSGGRGNELGCARQRRQTQTHPYHTTKLNERQEQTPAEILGPSIAVALSLGRMELATALLALLRRWQGAGDEW